MVKEKTYKANFKGQHRLHKSTLEQTTLLALKWKMNTSTLDQHLILNGSRGNKVNWMVAGQKGTDKTKDFSFAA